METYDLFKKHEHNFNTAIWTVTSVLLSAIIGAIAILLGVLETQNFWAILFAVLIIGPIIIYLTTDGVTEFKTAYYKTWMDVVKGKIDQRKILASFTKRYNIPDYRIKPNEIEADGRWNFRADTKYMRTIIYQRNLLLDDLEKEYKDKYSTATKEIIALEKIYEDRRSDLVAIDGLKENAKTLSKMSKIAAEKYYYREKEQEKISETLDAENRVHESLRDLNIAKKNRDSLTEVYQITVSQINKIYNERYAKYTEKVVRILNKIHGLKYKIADMSELEKGE